MEWYEEEVRTLERRGPGRIGEPRPVVFYGGSSIRLWTTLCRDVGIDGALNLGFGGATLAACVHFFPRLVPAVHPRSLIVYAGDNDLGDGLPVERVVASFCELAGQVTDRLDGIPWAFVSVKPSPARLSLLPAIAATNHAIRQHIGQLPLAFYVNVFTPMLDTSGLPRPELFLEDGLHLAPAGYQLWGDVIQVFRHRLVTTSSSDVTPPV